jgi:hypothetical protein
MIRGHDAPAKMHPTQNVQFQLTTDIKPDTGGPRMGPNVVAAMNIAIDLPLDLGSWYISAHMPPTTLIAAEPPMPTSNRNITSAAKLGETAEQIENMVNIAKAIIIVHFRPYDSLMGDQTTGPILYPTRYMDVGRMSCASFVLPKCAEIGAVAPAAREEFIVEFMTDLPY